MKTLLVPVDFTATSENAVNFAVEWCRKYEYERFILLKTFYDSMFESLLVSAEYSNTNQDYINRQREEDTEQLQTLCKNVAQRLDGVKVITAVSEYPLLRGIFEILRNENPDLIIVGSDNQSYSSASIVAANVISIAKASPIRVLVVPANYTYKPVKRALLPYNFNMLKDLDRLNSLRTSTHWKDLQLLILNIDTSQRIIKVPEKFNDAEDKFERLLKNFEYEIYYTKERNLVEGIASFTKEHDVQLVIALPGKHSFLYTLTHASISEAIYRNARYPVLILK